MDNQLLKEMVEKIDFLYERAKDHDRQLALIADKLRQEEEERQNA